MDSFMAGFILLAVLGMFVRDEPATYDDYLKSKERDDNKSDKP